MRYRSKRYRRNALKPAITSGRAGWFSSCASWPSSRSSRAFITGRRSRAFVGGEEEAFENQSLAWQASTVYFAVIELVAAVGLWLATPWGAVVWLITVVSMTVIELMFPAIYGGSLAVVAAEAVMLAGYLALAWMAARERPP